MECLIKIYDGYIPNLPKLTKQAEVCAHRLGKTMTYTEQSDIFRNGSEDIMAYGASKGLKFGVFWGMSTSSTYRDLALPYVNANQMWIDAYCNPTGASELGQISQADYEAQRDALLSRISDWFDVRPLALSFAYGNDTYKDYAINDFIGCRNSDKNVGTPYGVGYGSPNDIPYSKAYFKSKGSTSRWYDDAKADSSFTTRLLQLEQDVLATKLNGGWYNNFTHWHNVISDGNLQAYKNYIDLLASLNANNDIYFAGYGEAVAYLAYRQMINGVSINTTFDELTISLSLNSTDVDTSLLQVPVSVKFSTSGTNLGGQDIICVEGYNLIKIDDYNYIVEIPYSVNPVTTIRKL